MNPSYKDADRFGAKARDLSHHIDSSLINGRNAEIYLSNGETSKQKRSTGSKRRKTVRNQGTSKLSMNK